MPEDRRREACRGRRTRATALITAVLLAIVLLTTGCSGAAGRDASAATSSAGAKRERGGLQAEMDAYVARQYPDYQILQRNRYSDYRGTGAPGIDYILFLRSEPRFVLLVGVAKPASGTDVRLAQLGMWQSGDYRTTDNVLSKSAMEGSWVNLSFDDLVTAYVGSKPSSESVVVKTATMPVGAAGLGIAGKMRFSQDKGFTGPQDVTHVGVAEEDIDLSTGETVGLHYFLLPFAR